MRKRIANGENLFSIYVLYVCIGMIDSEMEVCGRPNEIHITVLYKMTSGVRWTESDYLPK